MRVELFDFELPAELIATQPAAPRDAARLLEVGSDGLVDRHIGDLPDLLRAGDLLVANDTKVIPARLHGKRGLAGIELLLHRHLDGSRWQAFARPAKKLKIGDRIEITPNFVALVRAKHDGGEVTVDFALPLAFEVSPFGWSGRPVGLAGALEAPDFDSAGAAASNPTLPFIPIMVSPTCISRPIPNLPAILCRYWIASVG